MGNTLPTQAAPQVDLRVLLQQDAPQFLYQELLGRGKFMKSLRAKHVPRDATGKTAPGESSISSEGRVVIKVYLKRGDGKEVKQRIQLAKEQLMFICGLLNLKEHPNLLPYQRFEESSRNDAVFLTRQHFMYNLYDRLNSRPFPTRIEKLWIIYQLLKAVEQAHSAGIRHGDIKIENVMCTSYNWILLTDFATFKPTYIPEDSPADFSFYFDSGNNRSSCCIAPERLVKGKDLEAIRAAGTAAAGAAVASSLPSSSLPSTAAADLARAGLLAEETGSSLSSSSLYGSSGAQPCAPSLRESMDIFSLGCTIAETVLDGEAFFEQHSLLKYKSGGSAGVSSSSAAPGVASGSNAAGSNSAGAGSVASAANQSAGSGSATAPSSSSGGGNANSADFDPMSGEGYAEYFKDFDPSGTVRDLVMHMIQRNPLRRSSARQYLETHTSRAAPVSIGLASSGPVEFSSGASFAPPALSISSVDKRLFPAWFPYLFSFFSRLVQPDMSSPDHQILAVAAAYPNLISNLAEGRCDPVGDQVFAHRLALEAVRGEPFRKTFSDFVASMGRAPVDWSSSSSSAAGGNKLGGRRKRRRDGNDGKDLHFSAGAQHAADVKRELQWEWGWEGGASSTPELWSASSQWSCDFTDVADPALRQRLQRGMANGSLTAIHEKWIQMKWASVPLEQQPAASSAGGSAATSSATMPSSENDATLPPPQSAAFHPRLMSVGSVASQGQRTNRSGGGNTGGAGSSTGARAVALQERIGALLSDADALLTSILNDTAPAPVADAIDQQVDGHHSRPRLASAPSPSPVPPAAHRFTGRQQVASNQQQQFTTKLVPAEPAEVQASALMLALLTSTLRRVTNPRTKLTAIALISRISAYTDDEVRLERVVPYLTTMFNDTSPLVRAHALESLTCVLESITNFPLSDSTLFPQYILPLVTRMTQDAEPIVQMACGECVPSLVRTAKRFLDIGQWRSQSAAVQKAVAAAAAATARSAASAASAAASAAAPVPSSTLPPAGSAESGTDELSSPSPVGDSGMLSPSVSASGATSSFTFPASSSSSAAIGQLGAAADLLDPTALARIKSTHDTDMAYLRRKVHNLLQKWVLNMTQYATATAAQVVLEDPAMMRLAIMNKRYEPLDAKGTFHGVDVTTDDNIISSAAILRLSDAIKSLPLVVDTSLMKRSLLAGSGIADLCAFFGREATEESVLPLLFTFLSDPAISIVLNTAGPAVVPVIVPIAGGGGASGAISSRTVNNGSSGDMLGSGSSGSIMTSQLTSLVLSWLNKSDLGGGDWQLRDAFLSKLVEVAAFVGPYNTQVQLLPFFEQAINAPYEAIVKRAFICLAELTLMRTLPKRTLLDLLNKYTCLLVHPGARVRQGVATFAAAVWQLLGWPSALMDTVSAINPYVLETRGDAVWSAVAAHLTHVGPSTSLQPAKILVQALLSSIMKPLSRSQYDAEAHSFVVSAMMDASPGLAARLRASRQPQQSAGQDGLGASFSIAPVDPLIRPGSDDASRGSSNPAHDYDSDLEEDLGYNPHDNEDDQYDGIAINSDDDAGPLRALDAASVAAAGGIGLESAAAPLQYGGPASSLCQFAPAFASKSQRRQYIANQMRGYIRTTAGPYRLSASTCSRMAAHAFAKQQKEASLAQPSSAIYSSVVSLDQAIVQDLLAGSAAPPPPYTDEELASLPARSISFPDQRYVSVHPQPPAGAAAKTPNPQDTTSMTDRPEHSAAVSLLARDPFASAVSEQAVTAVAKFGGAVIDAAATGSSLAAPGDDGITSVVLTVPPIESTLGNNAPLPEDVFEYDRIISQRMKAATKALRSDAAALLHPDGPVTGGAGGSAVRPNTGSLSLVVGTRRRRSSSVSTATVRQQTTDAYSFLQAVQPVRSPVHSGVQLARLAGANSRSNSFVSFAMGDSASASRDRSDRDRDGSRDKIDSLSRRQSALASQPFASPDASPLSPIQQALRLRSHWRRAGRTARRTYLRHGVWNPLLATDTAFAQAAGGMGVGTATAFFYSSGRAALHDDPTLYDSDTGGGGLSTSAGNARASSAALSLLPGAGAGADGKVRRGSKASASSVVGAARQAWGETMERRRSRAGTSDSSVSGSGGFAPQPSNASGGASSSQTGHERTSSNTSDPVTSNAGGAGTSSSAGGGGGVMLMGSDDGSGGGFYSSYGGGGSGNEPLDGDGPIIFPGSAPSDPRISAAVMAARFSAAAHAAITTSDGSAWAARMAGGAAGAAAGSAAAAQFAGSKGQGAAGNARASMALQGPLGSAQKRRAIVRKQSGILSTGGGTDDYGSMSTGSSGPAPQPQQPQPPAGASAEDASFVLTSYEAEQIVHKAGAYKVGQAGSSSNPSYSASGGASGNAGGASAASGQTAAGVIINPSYLGDGSSPAVSSANTASNSGKEAAKRKSTLFGSAAGTSNAVPNTRSKSIASASGAQGSSSNSGSAMYRGGDDRDFLSPAAAEALSRRIDALDLPPLPPHLGYLQKFSDPPAPVCAHAVRVATGVRPDAYSSVAVGVGSGVITSGGQGENTRQVLDESPRLAPHPNADDVALTASVLAGASSASAAATVAIDGDAASGDVDVDGFTLVEGPSSSSSPMIRSRAAASDGRVPHFPLSSSAGIEGSLPVVPVPLPVPEREDLIRPADVGDASGYVGAGRVSFLAIERGWKDGIGVGAPPGSSLIASVGILPSSNAAATSAAAQASGVNASEAAPAGPAAAGPAASAAAGSANWDGGDGTWGSRPRGLLLTSCAEHGAAVNALAVCQDHSFFASASDDGTVKVWPTRALDREVANQSLLTYTGHAQEVMLSRDIEKRLSSSPSLSTGSTKVNRVTDLCILDNTCSIASGSAAGTVHIYRIDLAAATSSKSGRMGTASGDMAGDDGGSAGGRGSMASPGQTGGILVAGNNAQQPSSKTVSFSAGAGPSHRQSLARFSSSADSGDNVMSSPLGPVGAGGAGDARMLPMGSIAELDHDGNGDVDLDDFEPFGTGFGDAGDSESARSNMAYFRTPEGVTLVRRLVFDASEGPVAVLRHFDTATQSILAVAMANGIVHGCDIRSRKEAWCCRLPSSLGVITAMEVCPGSTSILVGTDRGCVALYDIRFNLITACWRHSGRAPVSVLYPYVTLGLRSASLPFGSQSSSSQQQPPVQVSVCRQLAVGIGTGEDETSFWNLETGTCLRILRNLPEKVEIADAFRVPFLTKITIVNGRVIPSDEAWLNGYLSHPSSASTSPGAAASNADAVLSRLQSNGGHPDPRLGAHPLQAASNEYLLKKRPAHVRAVLCPLPTATVPSTGLLGYPEDSLDPSRLNAEAISTGADAFGAASGGGGASGYGLGGYGAGAGQLGFVLGGMRGAGAVRRRGLGFATGYTASSAAGGSTAAAAAAVSGAAGVPSTDEFKATDPRATQLLQVYGSSPSEGLPVWLLTAGTDGRVRCWDLDRPRASHTVCGSLPAHPRDGYEGAWARPVDPQVWDGDETPNGIASSAAGEGRAASVASPSPGHQSPSAPSSSAAAAVFTLDRDTDAPDAELDSALAKMRIRDQDHFPAFCGNDGISVRRPVPNESVLAALGLSRRLFARAQYSYWYQRNHPVRTIFAMPLSTLVAEADAANGGIPQNPYLAMKGPLPSGTGHVAAVTAMAWIDLPTRLLITAGKDGVIKVWR